MKRMKEYYYPIKKKGRDGWFVRIVKIGVTGSRTERVLKAGHLKADARKLIKELKENKNPQMVSSVVQEYHRNEKCCLRERQIRRGISTKFQEAFGDCQIHEINAQQIRSFIESHTDGKSAYTFNRWRAVLKNIFEKAIDMEALAGKPNPCDRIKRARLPSLEIKTPISKAEEAAILHYCGEHTVQFSGRRNRTDKRCTWLQNVQPAPWLLPTVKLAFATGFRAGTLIELSWLHVNFKTQMFSLPAEIMKTKTPLKIPIGEKALTILKELFAERDGSYVLNIKKASGDSELDRDAKVLMLTKNFTRAVKRARQEGELKRHLKFHSIRGTVASRLLNEHNMPIKTVQQLGGWRSHDVLLKHYAGRDEALEKKAADLI